MTGFIYFFIGLTVIYVLWDLSTRRFIDKYDSECLFGRKGCGKTSTLQMLRYKYKDDFSHFYSNTDLVGCIKIDGKLIGEGWDFPEDSLFLCDEIGILFPSRDFKNFGLKRIEWFKLQRHHKVKVICCSQSYEDMDKAIRLLFDRLYISKKYLRVLTISKEIVKIMDISNNTFSDDQINVGGQIIDTYKYGHRRYYTWIPHWILLFDSFATSKTGRTFVQEGDKLPEDADLFTFKGYVKHEFRALGALILRRVAQIREVLSGFVANLGISLSKVFRQICSNVFSWSSDQISFFKKKIGKGS